MAITEQTIEAVYSELKNTHGGVKQDYFGVLYLEREFKLPREEAIVQVAFGGNDYGIDAFHVDPERRILFLFQFKWTTAHDQFKGSLKRLIDAGVERIFGNPLQDSQLNQMLLQLKVALEKDKHIIEKVWVQFVFNGDPLEADRSQVLDKLREDLESKKHIMDEYFGRPINLLFDFRSARTRSIGAHGRQWTTHAYKIDMATPIDKSGPNGEAMHVGFLKLTDLAAMYKEMGQRFFERNIRSCLSEDEAPNREITKALRSIVLDEKQDPRIFAFNHNGVTIFAQKFDPQTGQIVEPRLLNGAQTVSTFNRFLEDNKDHPKLKGTNAALHEILVQAKVITNAKDEFVVSVTVNNNRQNPVMPWDLRANDFIQLEIQDLLRRELGIYYERQAKAFESLRQEDLEELDITENRAIEMRKLAQTFLAAEGEIDKMSRLKEIFENDKMYTDVFNDNRLRVNLQDVVLCYKIQFRLGRLIREIVEKGERRYSFMYKARNLLWALLCQAVLNDRDHDAMAETYGKGLVIESGFTEWVAKLASTRARPIISEIIKTSPYSERAKEEKYDFLRNRAVFEKCMDIAYKRWKWIPRKLK